MTDLGKPSRGQVASIRQRAFDQNQDHVDAIRWREFVAASKPVDLDDMAAEYTRRYAEPLYDVGQELRSNPLHKGLLAPNEQWGYSLIERVVFRHAFYDHDCQTVGCKAMFLWNSHELTVLLKDAFDRGLAEAKSDIVEEAHREIARLRCELDEWERLHPVSGDSVVSPFDQADTRLESQLEAPDWFEAAGADDD